MEDLSNVIVLTDEHGVDTEFEFLDLVKFEGNEYVLLLPVESSDTPGEFVILQVENSDDEDIQNFTGVEDDRILEAVFELFRAKFRTLPESLL